jgi:hypothetical protein
MADLDTTGAEGVVALFDELRDADVDMWLTRLHGYARITAEKAGVVDAIGDERILPNLRSAASQVLERYPDLAGPSTDD